MTTKPIDITERMEEKERERERELLPQYQPSPRITLE
jgi:hypothetical protein